MEKHILEIKDKNGDLLRESDLVIGYRQWMAGDGYLKKSCPNKIRVILKILWDKHQAKYRLKEIKIHNKDKQFEEEMGSYRELSYRMRVSWDNNICNYRKDMRNMTLEKYISEE